MVGKRSCLSLTINSTFGSRKSPSLHKMHGVGDKESRDFTVIPFS